MSADMQALEARVRILLEQVEQKLVALGDAQRLANGTLRDFRAEVRAVKEEIRVGLREQMRAEIEQQVQMLSDATKRAMELSVSKVYKEFDKLAGILLGLDDGGTTMEELITEVAKIRKSKDG